MQSVALAFAEKMRPASRQSTGWTEMHSPRLEELCAFIATTNPLSDSERVDDRPNLGFPDPSNFITRANDVLGASSYKLNRNTHATSRRPSPQAGQQLRRARGIRRPPARETYQGN